MTLLFTLPASPLAREPTTPTRAGGTVIGDLADIDSPPRKARDEVLRAMWGPEGVPGAPVKRRRHPRAANESPARSPSRDQSPPPTPLKLFTEEEENQSDEEINVNMRTPVRRRRVGLLEDIDETPARPTRGRVVATAPQRDACRTPSRERPSGKDKAAHL
eukprot:CAMPEP_0197907432 /NCGR_PEP_ID=MMETSP1439-20131203/64822_1 /TAXON_ID=66791 /ORGANISM="Gonyaulax spinifera, Strain CCMP409" /LENGTH=160 /DNA_ID=CAMNT_0043528863 /DNA_START=69 /DNA_END=551 /DNA_ORIENTATION=-